MASHPREDDKNTGGRRTAYRDFLTMRSSKNVFAQHHGSEKLYQYEGYQVISLRLAGTEKMKKEKNVLLYSEDLLIPILFYRKV